MNASCTVARPAPSGQYLRVSAAASFYGVSSQTIRNEIERGNLTCVRTGGLHRRVSLASLREFYEGVSPEDENEAERGCGVSVYARVSDCSQNTKGQDGKSSLERQLERLLTEVSQREGVAQEEIRVFKDVASSFGDRIGLNNLIDTVISGTTKKVYCL